MHLRFKINSSSTRDCVQRACNCVNVAVVFAGADDAQARPFLTKHRASANSQLFAPHPPIIWAISPIAHLLGTRLASP